MASDHWVLYMEDFWYSPYVFSSWVALKEKGVKFEEKIIKLQNGEQKDPEYKKKSLTAKVPSIEHGNFSLSESSAIAEYLEDILPPPKYQRLLPSDVQHRATARQLMAWLRSDLMPLREERSTTTMFFAEHKAKAPLSEKAKLAAEKLIRVAESVIPEDSGNLFGEWTLVDAELAFMLHRLILNDEEVPAKVLKYAQAQWKRPSVAEFVNHERKPFVPYQV